MSVVTLRGTHHALDQFIGGVAKNRNYGGAGGEGQLGNRFAGVNHLDVGDYRTTAMTATQLTHSPDAFADEQRSSSLYQINIRRYFSSQIQLVRKVGGIQCQLQFHCVLRAKSEHA